MDNKNTDKTVVSKPVTVAQSDLVSKIINDINNSNLHPALLMPVIEEIYTLMKNTLNDTREREKAEYEKAIKELAENNKNNESK